MTKHTSCIITFQKGNGNIIMRPRMDTYGLRVGDKTSMGWKVIDIHYQFVDGNYYREEDYSKKIKEIRKQKTSMKQKIANVVISRLKEWSYE